MLSCDRSTAVLKAESLWYHELKFCSLPSRPRLSPTSWLRDRWAALQRQPGRRFSGKSSSTPFVRGTKSWVWAHEPFSVLRRAPFRAGSPGRKTGPRERALVVFSDQACSLAPLFPHLPSLLPSGHSLSLYCPPAAAGAKHPGRAARGNFLCLSRPCGHTHLANHTMAPEGKCVSTVSTLGPLQHGLVPSKASLTHEAGHRYL